MGIGGGLKSNLDNEIEILKSRTLVERTVLKLGLNISIIEKGRVNSIERYKNGPIELHFINTKPGFYTEGMSWEFVKLTPNTFKLINKVDGKNSLLSNNNKELRYGAVIATTNGDLIINKSNVANSSSSPGEDKTITIVISPLEDVVASFQKRLQEIGRASCRERVF